MLTHIFKLIWKKKASNFLLMLEIFFSFIVLFAVYSFASYLYKNYKGQTGINIDDVWVATVEFKTDTTANTALIRQRLKTYPEVSSFSFSTTNVPYSFSTMNNTLSYEGREAMTDHFDVDPNYGQTMGVQLSAGRWFTAEDTIGGKYQPMVITKALAEALFGDNDPIGKAWNNSENGTGQGHKVVGVVDHFKHKSDFQERGNCCFQPFTPDKGRNAIMLKMKPGADANFEARLTKDLLQLGSGWSVEIQHLDKMKATQNMFYWVPLLIALAVCGFLAINVALGLFGVLFQNINRRRGEIGLRRAMGATKTAVQRQFIGETAMLTTFGVALGAFFAVQFPLLSVFDLPASVYLSGIALATITIYGLTLLCAWYPSRQAAAVFPAEALREE